MMGGWSRPGARNGTTARARSCMCMYRRREGEGEGRPMIFYGDEHSTIQVRSSSSYLKLVHAAPSPLVCVMSGHQTRRPRGQMACLSIRSSPLLLMRRSCMQHQDTLHLWRPRINPCASWPIRSGTVSTERISGHSNSQAATSGAFSPLTHQVGRACGSWWGTTGARSAAWTSPRVGQLAVYAQRQYATLRRSPPPPPAGPPKKLNHSHTPRLPVAPSVWAVGSYLPSPEGLT
jgi:hypothetical protein